MIVSIASGKAFDNIQHDFMINIFNKLGIEGNILKLKSFTKTHS